MKMKKETIMKLQKTLTKISLNSIGRSFPIGCYERKIPEAVLKMHNENSKQKYEEKNDNLQFMFKQSGMSYIMIIWSL